MTEPESSQPKYGSRGETSAPRMTKRWRDRMRIVAAHRRMKMIRWLEEKIVEDEIKYGIVNTEEQPEE